jgi:hypothetical protein
MRQGGKPHRFMIFGESVIVSPAEADGGKSRAGLAGLVRGALPSPIRVNGARRPSLPGYRRAHNRAVWDFGHAPRRGTVMIRWNSDATRAPLGVRLLLIATPEGTNEADLESDIVVGHRHDEGFVRTRLEHPSDGSFRPTLQVAWWAEIPDLPDGVELRELGQEDFKG